MRVRMHGARGRVVQNGIVKAHVFLLTRAPWAEPNGSVYYVQTTEAMASVAPGLGLDAPSKVSP